jgi:hypothetical protein
MHYAEEWKGDQGDGIYDGITECAGVEVSERWFGIIVIIASPINGDVTRAITFTVVLLKVLARRYYRSNLH